QLRLAAQDLERKQALLRRNGISQALVDDAQAHHDLALVRVAMAEARLADSRIAAPFDAVVGRRFVDNRNRVQVGEPIVRLLDLHHLDVITDVPGNLFATVARERVDSVTATFDFLPGRTFALAYRESSGEANPVAQTYQVRFSMPRPEGVNILPGMT